MNENLSNHNHKNGFGGGVWLYCTMEPCVMCLSSAYLFRIDHIVYGTIDVRLGAITTSSSKSFTATATAAEPPSSSNGTTTNKSSTVELPNFCLNHPFHTITSIQQIQNETLRKECSTVIQDFFRKKRSIQKQKKLEQNKREKSATTT